MHNIHFILNFTIPDAMVKLPLLSDSRFILDMHRELIKNTTQKWQVEPIWAMLRFAWAVTLRQLSQYTDISHGKKEDGKGFQSLLLMI